MGALSSRLLLDWTEKDKILFLVVFFALFTLWIVLFMVFDISCVCCITSDGMLIVYINSSFLVFM